MFGIDVSVNNGRIDWAAARVGKAGVSPPVEFAMIKATQGHGHTYSGYLFTDSRFARNLTDAHDCGIRCGAYHWLTARTVEEAEREADCFVSAIEPFGDKLSLYAAVDVEDELYLRGLSKRLCTDIVHAFCGRVTAAGFKSAVYTNNNYLQWRLEGAEIIAKYPIWQAHWSKSKPTTAGERLVIWQNEVRGSAADVACGRATVIGSVAGVSGCIDCNLGYFDSDPAPIAVGDMVLVRIGAKSYTGGAVSRRWYDTVKRVDQLAGDRAVLDIHGWCTAFRVSDLQRQ